MYHEHLSKYKYIPHKDREVRINSAHIAIKALLPLDLYLSHKKELLSACIWKITEADGKLKVRFWSEGALAAPPKELRHEHVFERRELITRLLSGEDVDSVLNNAVACIVTKQEHVALSRSAKSGWERYMDCKIRVLDCASGEWMRFE
jgi:hypothetical protein